MYCEIAFEVIFGNIWVVCGGLRWFAEFQWTANLPDQTGSHTETTGSNPKPTETDHIKRRLSSNAAVEISIVFSLFSVLFKGRFLS